MGGSRQKFRNPGQPAITSGVKVKGNPKAKVCRVGAEGASFVTGGGGDKASGHGETEYTRLWNRVKTRGGMGLIDLHNRVCNWGVSLTV